MTLYMETTKISPKVTAQQISTILAQAGARAVLTEYGTDGKISALCFKLEVRGELVPFSLPARIEPMFLYFQKKSSSRNRTKNANVHLEQAERVAWRQLYRWIEAQLALIETGMVTSDEVFFPYIQTGPHETLYEKLSAKPLSRLLLPERT